jgi:hypothetical protein
MARMQKINIASSLDSACPQIRIAVRFLSGYNKGRQGVSLSHFLL